MKRNHQVLQTISWLLLSVSTAIAVPKAPPIEERVRELKLDNGMTIVVAERHNSPVFFTLTNFRVGSNQELPNRSGLAHFLEHMLFKGTKTVATKNYAAEKPLMEEIEKAAAVVQSSIFELQSWRYELFEDYALKVRAALPVEILDAGAGNESLLWNVLLDSLPKNGKELPADIVSRPWAAIEGGKDYWQVYRNLLWNRAEVARLMMEQKEYIDGMPNLDGIYDQRGSAMMNAFTNHDQTTYMVGLPSNCLELFMYLESDRFQNPVFREFYSEREVVMEELRNGENDPDDAIWHNFMATAFDAHPYGRPIIGWLGDIRSTTKSDMEAFFWKYYTPTNCMMVIVGDVKTDEVFRLATKYFSSWKPGEKSPEVTIKEPSQTGERRIVVARDAEPKLMIGYHIPTAPHPDAYALNILQSVLSGGRTTRFHKNIFEGKQLTQGSPAAFDGPGDRYPNMFIVNAVPKSPHTNEEVEAAIYEEIEKVKKEPISDWELERIRNRLRVHELGRMADNRALAFTLTSSYVQFGDWRNVVTEFNRRMEVTPADVMRVANTYLTPENRVVAFLVKESTEQAVLPSSNGGAK